VHHHICDGGPETHLSKYEVSALRCRGVNLPMVQLLPNTSGILASPHSGCEATRTLRQSTLSNVQDPVEQSVPGKCTCWNTAGKRIGLGFRGQCLGVRVMVRV